MHVLGIDAGGTKTIGYLADGEGKVLGEGRAGGANLKAEGELAVEKVLHTVMDLALGNRNLEVGAICLGMAGADRDDEKTLVADIMRRIGARSRTLVVNDALVALVAGVGDASGVVIICGTARSPSAAAPTARRAPAAGATSWATRAAATGSGAGRCAPWRAPRTGAARPPRSPRACSTTSR
jgi:hypothetical protein